MFMRLQTIVKVCYLSTTSVDYIPHYFTWSVYNLYISTPNSNVLVHQAHQMFFCMLFSNNIFKVLIVQVFNSYTLTIGKRGNAVVMYVCMCVPPGAEGSVGFHFGSFERSIPYI